MSGNEYHKIDSVFLRDSETKHKSFLMGQWARPEFGYLAECDWVWTEKIDGTNIRVTWDRSQPESLRRPRFEGRTSAAQIPSPLFNRLVDLFDTGDARAALATVFPADDTDSVVTLYGEGYGRGIQKDGELYRPEGPDFILFDVRVGNIWLRRDAIEDIANELGLGTVPVVAKGTIAKAIDLVRAGFQSYVNPLAQAEGLVLRPAIELNDRMGRRIITKIKTKDFAYG